MGVDENCTAKGRLFKTLVLGDTSDSCDGQ